MPRQPAVRRLDYKDPRGYEYALIDLDLLIPDPINPRIPNQESVLDTIVALVREDSDALFALGTDLVDMRGGNPAELLNVTPREDGFVVKEGNRRLVARKLLRNPEVLRGHASDAEVQRWTRLSRNGEAQKLPRRLLCVIGDDHEPWIDRRHLGPQGGIGVEEWNPQAKKRRDMQRGGAADRTLLLLDGLRAQYPDRIGPLEPPKRTFTTFERAVDSTEGRAHIGIDVDADGKIVLTRGERSLHMIEEILRDLRKPRTERLTSRRIHDADDIVEYLSEVEQRIGKIRHQEPITLPLVGRHGTSGNTASSKPQRNRTPDLLRSFHVPTAARLRKIFEELGKARKAGAPNAATVLLRVLLELSIDHYAEAEKLAFAGDTNDELEREIAEFLEAQQTAGVQTPKRIREALKWASRRPLSLGEKLEKVIRDLIAKDKLPSKEGHAKIRELKAHDVVALLNDAVHRLEHFPSPERVDHMLLIVRPVFNALNPK
jgi:hypothetical protein